MADLPKDKEIIFYCARGGRARAAARKLGALGFSVASSGGYGDWLKAGLPTQRPDVRPEPR